MMDSNAASRAAASLGKSSSRKNGPREVPPRINKQGMDLGIERSCADVRYR
jgi:hypothetical protein